MTTLKAHKAQLEASRKVADVARAQVAQVKMNLGFTVVRVPLAGVVIVKAAQVGERLAVICRQWFYPLLHRHHFGYGFARN